MLCFRLSNCQVISKISRTKFLLRGVECNIPLVILATYQSIKYTFNY